MLIGMSLYRFESAPSREKRLTEFIVGIRKAAITQVGTDIVSAGRILHVHDDKGELTVVWDSQQSVKTYGHLSKPVWEMSGEWSVINSSGADDIYNPCYVRPLLVGRGEIVLTSRKVIFGC